MCNLCYIITKTTIHAKMLPWKLRYTIMKTKLIIEFEYLKYRIKSFFGFKTVGFDEPYSLITFKILKKHTLPKFSMGVSNYTENIDTIDLVKNHGRSLRIDKGDYLSIHLNPKKKQVRLTVGENMNSYINEVTKQEIEDEMIQYIQKNEILAGLEIGIKKINQLITS